MKVLRAALLLALVGAHPAAAGFNWSGQVEADAADLSSDDPKKRLDAVSLLALDDIHLAQPFLMKALADEDPSVRQQAAKALGAGGAVAAVPRMIEWLSDQDTKTRVVAAEVLGDIGGPEATQALIRSLGDADDAVRQRAVKSLGKIGQRGNPGVVTAIIPRLEDTKSSVKAEAVEQLEELGDKRAVIPLVAKFDDTSQEVKKAAIRAVGKLGDRAAVPALVRKTNDPDEATRMAAVGSLGQLGAVDAIDALVEQLATGSQAYRAKVAYALGQIAASPGAGKAGEDAMRTLVENLAQHDTRDAARDALRVAGKAAVPALVAHLSGRLKGDPTTAVALLADSADARATAALSAELERGRVAMPLVLKALGATGDPAALVPVLGALSNRDAAIRVAAMNALRPLLGRDARAADVLIEHLADDDLEVRVLAAEYLGILHASAAAPKLVALAGPGNPTRLRLAAIDALGEIGATPTSGAATKMLLDVLREGPSELHKSAATALSYIADAAAIPALVQQAKVDRGPTRDEIVRALGSTLRGHADATARKLLRDLTEDNNVKVALAAIGGLAAAGDSSDAPLLRAFVEQGAADRRRAAASALGDLHDTGAFGVLADALSTKDDRLVGDAAWALGELASVAPKDPHVAPLTERFLYVARHGGWAGSIDATAALARTLWALPGADRTALVAGERRHALLGLAFHKSRAVRANAALAIAALGGDDAVKTLTQLLHDDASPHVRIAAAHGLAHLGTKDPRIAAALAAATDGDSDVAVKAAAKAAQAGPPAPIARSEWRTFYVVEPNTDDTPVRQVPYFIFSDDGLVWATYTDARGEIDSEHVPPATLAANVWPASHENEF